ncbi:MAG: hypothetical protein RIR52_1209 [Acidobacteriota bacterium]|jgi:D-alanyl-D-alanine dipeptidase
MKGESPAGGQYAMTWVLGVGLITLLAGCSVRIRMAEGRSLLGEERVASARQMILVVTPGWNSIGGQLSQYERSAGMNWRRLGGSIPVVVGRNGLAWADEYAGAPGRSGDPIKREGDGRSPAGIFTLGSAFGYEPAAALGRLTIDYLQVTKSWECVDDCKSSFYNQLTDGSQHPGRDWASSEAMRRDDDYYRLGVVINHNFPNPVACRGSCIFLHIWEGPEVGTVGCTAMAPGPMEQILRWLDRSASPVLVQLTETNRRELKWIPDK